MTIYMCVCVYIYICISMYVCICVSVYIYLCVCMYMWFYIFIYIYIRLYINVSGNVCVCVCIYIYIWICWWVCVCIMYKFMCLQQSAGGIGLHLNTNKTLCVLNKEESSPLQLAGLGNYYTSSHTLAAISHPLKLILILEALTAIEMLMILWKSDLSNKIKTGSLPSSVCVYTTV